MIYDGAMPLCCGAAARGVIDEKRRACRPLGGDMRRLQRSHPRYVHRSGCSREEEESYDATIRNVSLANLANVAVSRLSQQRSGYARFLLGRSSSTILKLSACMAPVARQ